MHIFVAMDTKFTGAKFHRLTKWPFTIYLVITLGYLVKTVQSILKCLIRVGNFMTIIIYHHKKVTIWESLK